MQVTSMGTISTVLHLADSTFDFQIGIKGTSLSTTQVEQARASRTRWIIGIARFDLFETNKIRWRCQRWWVRRWSVERIFLLFSFLFWRSYPWNDDDLSMKYVCFSFSDEIERCWQKDGSHWNSSNEWSIKRREAELFILIHWWRFSLSMIWSFNFISDDNDNDDDDTERREKESTRTRKMPVQHARQYINETWEVCMIMSITTSFRGTRERERERGKSNA